MTDPFDCKRCGARFSPAPTQWICHGLCDACFGLYDDQKMHGRNARLAMPPTRPSYFEDSADWIATEVAEAAKAVAAVSCDQAHAAPTCADPACFREAYAIRADNTVPGLGDLIRRGLLDPDPPRGDEDHVEEEQWADGPAKIVPPATSWLHALRVADLGDPATPDRLTDEELTTWTEQSGVSSMNASTYLRYVIDELRERRDTEAVFAEVDQRYQALDCDACDAEAQTSTGYCATHKSLVREWRKAREDLLDQARIHRGHLLDGMKVLFGKVPP